jgi:hypothetical protein
MPLEKRLIGENKGKRGIQTNSGHFIFYCVKQHIFTNFFSISDGQAIQFEKAGYHTKKSIDALLRLMLLFA